MTMAAAARVRTLAIILSLVAALLAAGPSLWAQNPLAPLITGGRSPASSPASPPASPPAGEPADEGVQEGEGETDGGRAPVAELIPRLVTLDDEAVVALGVIDRLADVAALTPRVAALVERQEGLSSRLEGELASEYVNDDRVGALARRGEELRRAIDGLMKTVSDRLVRLSEIRREWSGRREEWRAWQDDLADEPDLAAAYASEIDRALGRTTEVVGAVDHAIPGLVELQRGLQEADAGVRAIGAQGEALLESWRAQLWQRGSPVLFSPAHRERHGGRAWAELRTAARSFRRVPREPTPRTFWLVLLQAGVAVGAGWLASRLRPKVPGDSRWAEVLRHPWAIGVLVGAAGLGFLHGPLSPAARLPLVAAATLSASVVGTGMFRNPQKRLVVYLVSALYLTFAVLGSLDPPLPLFRVGLAALALAGIPALLLLASATTRRGWREQRGFLAVLRLGAVALAAVLAAEVAGFHFLAQWLFEASVATAFVGFVVTFLIRLARGAFVLLFHTREGAGSGFRARMGEVLTERLMFLAKLVLVACGVLYILSIWDVAESPGDAWRALVSAGVSVGEWRLTVGRVLLALAAVYLAFLSSWVVRALLDQSFFDRRPFERGVRDSISTLLHYSILVVGVFVALALFGLDLSTFALLAGALGVGIGFGLQNVVNNFVSGLVLLFERPLRVGDIAVVGGESGTIRKIGLRSTVLETFNGAELIIPNGDLIAEKVTNWTLTSPKARLVLPVSAAYGNDPARILAVLEEVGRAFPRALAEPAPAATFQGFGESSLDFDLRVWLAAFDEMLPARSELGAAVAGRFAAEGIVIPFPQRTVHVEREAAAGGDPTPGEGGGGRG